MTKKFNCRLIGGYNGKHGSVTAHKTINLPCAPFKHMEIETGGRILLVLHEDNEDGWHISWNENSDEWFFATKDIDDCSFSNMTSIEEIENWYKSKGWDVSETYKSRQKTEEKC